METRSFKYFPVVTCLTSAILLAGFGLVCLYSALRGSLGVPVNLLNKQIVLLGCALGICTAIGFTKELLYRRFVWIIGVSGLAVLGLVLIPGIGVEVNGARRWLDFGFTRLQPSELVKFGYIIGLAIYLNHFQRYKREFLRGLFIPCVYIASFAGLILLEPDYGTAFLYGAVGMTMLFLWGAPLYWFTAIGVAGAGVFGLLIWQDPVRWKRITSFMDVEGNKSDGAYQLYQSMLAFGSGGVSGVGIGNGRQQHAYLPESHTDFILPVIGEELGLLATFSIIVLFSALFVSVVMIAKRTSNTFWFLICIGAGSFIVYQAMFNAGVVTGLLPTKGISLPFISYGGANLVGSFMLVGLLMASWRQSLVNSIKKPREL
jgi:cell division protein FtsW